jgi:hypothetical protein
MIICLQQRGTQQCLLEMYRRRIDRSIGIGIARLAAEAGRAAATPNPHAGTLRVRGKLVYVSCAAASTSAPYRRRAGRPAGGFIYCPCTDDASSRTAGVLYPRPGT